MTSEDLVVLRRYGTEAEARFDATVLEANGIAARVLADTAGGALPSMAILIPVRLVVRAEDAAVALELLDVPAPNAGEDESPG